ncbi:MAG: hydrogenase maturation protease [Halococcoides sp.]
MTDTVVPAARPLVVLGMGSDQGDDRAGIALVEAIAASDPAGVTAIAGGVAPENYTGPIRRADPAAVLVVDAVEWEAAPGAIDRFAVADLRAGSISTHSAPPTMLVDFLEQTTDAGVTLVGIQPDRLDGDHLSVPVARAVANLVRDITGE